MHEELNKTLRRAYCEAINVSFAARSEKAYMPIIQLNIAEEQQSTSCLLWKRRTGKRNNLILTITRIV